MALFQGTVGSGGSADAGPRSRPPAAATIAAPASAAAAAAHDPPAGVASAPLSVGAAPFQPQPQPQPRASVPLAPPVGPMVFNAGTSLPAGDTQHTPAQPGRGRKRQNTGTPPVPRRARATVAQQLQATNALMETVSHVLRMVTQHGNRLTALEQNKDLAQHSSIADLKRCFMVFLPKSKHSCSRDVQKFSAITAADIAEKAGREGAAFTILGRGRTWLRVICDTQDLRHHMMKAQTRRHFRAACGVVLAEDLSEPERQEQKRMSQVMRCLYGAGYKPSWRRSRIFIRRNQHTALLSCADFELEGAAHGQPIPTPSVLAVADAKLKAHAFAASTQRQPSRTHPAPSPTPAHVTRPPPPTSPRAPRTTPTAPVASAAGHTPHPGPGAGATRHLTRPSPLRKPRVHAPPLPPARTAQPTPTVRAASLAATAALAGATAAATPRPDGEGWQTVATRSRAARGRAVADKAAGAVAASKAAGAGSRAKGGGTTARASDSPAAARATSSGTSNPFDVLGGSSSLNA